MSLMLRHIDDLGPVTIDSFHNQTGLKLRTYVWSTLRDANGNTIQPKGIVIAIHGLSSHAQFDYLNHADRLNLPEQQITTESESQSESKDHPRAFAYQGSWPETFNQSGYIFCAYDQQGHGYSESWQNSRCNVEMFDHLAFDALQFAIIMHRLHNNQNKGAATDNHSSLPITFMGISMGGGVVLRTLSLYSYITKYKLIPPCINEHDSFMANQRTELPRSWWSCSQPIQLTTNNTSRSKHQGYSNEACAVTVPNVCNLPRIRGISMCPNISLNSLKKIPLNRVLAPLARPASYLLPCVGVGSLARNNRFPWIDEDKFADARDTQHGMYVYKIPARMAYQNLLLGPRILEDTSLLLDDYDDDDDFADCRSCSFNLEGSFPEANNDGKAEECSNGGNSKNEDSTSNSDNSKNEDSTSNSDQQSSDSDQQNNDQQNNNNDPQDNNNDCSNRTTDQQNNNNDGSNRTTACTPTLAVSRRSPLSLLLIHSRNDEMTDCDGSVEVLEKVKERMKDVQLFLLEDMWHMLTLEEGYELLRDRIVYWMDQRHGEEKKLIN